MRRVLAKMIAAEFAGREMISNFSFQISEVANQVGRVIRLLTIIAGISSCAAWAARAEDLGMMKGFEPEKDGVLVRFEKGLMKVSALEDGIIRVRATDQTSYEPDQSFAIMKDSPQAKAVKVWEDEEGLNFETNLLKGKILKAGGSISIYDRNNNLILSEPESGGIFFEGGKPGVARRIPAGEHYYGFGEKTGGLDKLGERLVMWNSDQSYGTKTDPIYQSHPIYLALRKGMSYGIFLDNSYRSVFDVGKSDSGELRYQADGGELNYYFIFGPTPKEAIAGYGRLAGGFPLPPLWALGNMQCRYSYRDEGQVLAITRKFRQFQVPCDVIFLDIHYMDAYKVFTFHPRRFPDPAGLLADLEKDGFKVITIVDPGVKIEPGYYVYDQGLKNDYFVRSKNNGYFQARVWPGDVYFPDFLKPEVREWWGNLHKFLLDLGVDGIWNDMNEPAGWVEDVRLGSLMVPSGGPVPWLEMVHGSKDQAVDHAKIHNVYALLEAQGTYEGLKRNRPDQRPFVISRAGYPGLQRYSSVWTGDNFATWPELRLSLTMLLNLGISGIPDVGTDIGGFVLAPSGEMYARWLQQGVFYPFCRTHTAIYHPSQDPFSYGPEVQAISKRALELRYRLLPYTYTYFKEASETDLPMMRAMLLEFPDDEKTYQLSQQFMWGDWLLVAPVTVEGTRQKKVYLPAGNWYRFEQGERIPGGKEIVEMVTLADLPLYVREGGIVPLAPVMNYTGEKPWSPLSVEFYGSEQKTCFELYEDAGDGFDYLKGEYLVSRYCQEPVAQGLLISKAEGKGNYQPVERELFLKVFGVRKPNSVELSVGKGFENLAYLYDAENAVIELRLKDQIRDFEIKIGY